MYSPDSTFTKSALTLSTQSAAMTRFARRNRARTARHQPHAAGRLIAPLWAAIDYLGRGTRKKGGKEEDRRAAIG